MDMPLTNFSQPENAPVALTKREVAELSIRNAIETGKYKPGQVISQRQIVEDFGLSVTPIREAILVLSGNGIVQRHKHHSIKVTEIDSTRLREIFAVRQMLEEQAVRWTAAACNAQLVTRLKRLNRQLEAHIADPVPEQINLLDRAFHGHIFEACGNQALVWTIDRVKSSFPMYALWNEPGRIETSISEHWCLIEAFEKNDQEAAAHAQVGHLSNGLKATIAYLERVMDTKPAA